MGYNIVIFWEQSEKRVPSKLKEKNFKQAYASRNFLATVFFKKILILIELLVKHFFGRQSASMWAVATLNRLLT